MTTTITGPDRLHATYQGPQDPDATWRHLKATIEAAINNDPRTLQVEIGPSEIADPCTHCLAARLAGWTENDGGNRWLTYIGRAVHDALAAVFIEDDNDRTACNTNGLTRQYWVEGEVTVGTIGGRPITGHSDLFNIPHGLVVDWKIVGPATLRNAKRGPSKVYRGQTHAYGRGWAAAGYRVDNVAIAYLPRNSVSLDHAVFWHEPYDEQIAVDALTRADHINTQLKALTAVSAEVRDQWITSLPRDPDCHQCMRYPDRPTTTVPSSIDDALGAA